MQFCSNFIAIRKRITRRLRTLREEYTRVQGEFPTHAPAGFFRVVALYYTFVRTHVTMIRTIRRVFTALRLINRSSPPPSAAFHHDPRLVTTNATPSTNKVRVVRPTFGQEILKKPLDVPSEAKMRTPLRLNPITAKLQS